MNLIECETNIQEWIDWGRSVHPYDVGRSDTKHVADIMEQLRNAIEARDKEIERLTDELDNERARGIHSCGPHCQRLECKQHREIERLRAALERIVSILGHNPDETYHTAREALK